MSDEERAREVYLACLRSYGRDDWSDDDLEGFDEEWAPIAAALREAREAERERCAKVAEELACLGPRDEGYNGTCCPGCHAMVAAKIRAMGDA